MEKKLHSLKRTIALFMALVAVICFSGCIRYSVTATVDKDGTVDLVWLYAMQDDYASDMDDMDSLREAVENVGYDFEIDEYDEDDYTGYTVSILDIPLDDLERTMTEGVEIEGFQVDEDDGVYTIRWDAGDVTGEAESSGVDGKSLNQYGGFMRFSITIPGNSISDNADEVNDTTYSWDLLGLSEPAFISFTLAGSYPFPYRTKVMVNKDKTADLEVLIAAVEEEDDALEERIGIFEDNDWEITEEEGKKVTAIFGEKYGLEIEEISEELLALGIGYEGFEVEFDEDEEIYSLNWDALAIAGNADTSEISSSAKKDYGPYMTFVLELPNSAEEENATEADGKILTWELLDMDEEIHAEFKVKKQGFPMWVIGVIIGGVIIVAGIVVMIIILSKRKKSPKDPVSAASAVPAPAPAFIPQPTSSAIPVGLPQQPTSPIAAPQQPASPFAPQPSQPAPAAPQAPQTNNFQQYGQQSGFPQTSGLPQAGFQQTMGLPVVEMPSSNEAAPQNNDPQLPPENQG
ncbi:MAG: hypothetical protein K6A81_06135 [Clostridiales bacterium]|nr:hypothetical protein [Clostridiales bacterium]